MRSMALCSLISSVILRVKLWLKNKFIKLLWRLSVIEDQYQLWRLSSPVSTNWHGCFLLEILARSDLSSHVKSGL